MTWLWSTWSPRSSVRLFQSIQAEICSSVEPAAVVPVTPAQRDFNVGGGRLLHWRSKRIFLIKLCILIKKDLISFCYCMGASTFHTTQIIFSQTQIPVRSDPRLSSDHGSLFSAALWRESHHTLHALCKWHFPLFLK